MRAFSDYIRNGRETLAPVFQPLSLLDLVFSLATTAYWFSHTPAPGKAVGLLGAVAVFMALRGDVKETHGGEKVVWIMLVFALLYIELRAIDKDRAEHDKQQAKARKEEARNFQSIASGITGEIKASQDQFDATMKRSDTILTRVPQ